MQWNARAEAGWLAAGMGCLYTAQDFEFDYVGVIFGRDLVYRPGVGWVGQPEESKDRIVARKNVLRTPSPTMSRTSTACC